jgi:hypothetical protein
VAGDAARHAHEEELQVVVVLEHAFGDEGLHEAGDVELLHADLRRDVHEAIRLEVPESNLGVRGEEGLEEVADLDASAGPQVPGFSHRAVGSGGDETVHLREGGEQRVAEHGVDGKDEAEVVVGEVLSQVLLREDLGAVEVAVDGVPVSGGVVIDIEAARAQHAPSPCPGHSLLPIGQSIPSSCCPLGPAAYEKLHRLTCEVAKGKTLEVLAVLYRKPKEDDLLISVPAHELVGLEHVHVHILVLLIEPDADEDSQIVLRDPSFLPLHDLPVQVDFLEECVTELSL